MDLFRLLGGDAQSAAGKAPAASGDVAARWRSELERAQWALRRGDPRAVPGARPEAGATPDSTGGLEKNRIAASGPDGSAQDAGGGLRHETKPFEARSTRQGPPAPGSEKTFLETPVEPFAVPGPAREACSRALAPERAPEASREPVRIEWARTHVHARRGEEGAQVWVRDASIEDGALGGLAAELRARMRAAGLKLAALVVNGKTVVAPPSPDEPENRNPD